MLRDGVEHPAAGTRLVPVAGKLVLARISLFFGKSVEAAGYWWYKLGDQRKDLAMNRVHNCWRLAAVALAAVAVLACGSCGGQNAMTAGLDSGSGANPSRGASAASGSTWVGDECGTTDPAAPAAAAWVGDECKTEDPVASSGSGNSGSGNNSGSGSGSSGKGNSGNPVGNALGVVKNLLGGLVGK
jgi:hypothetical protein